MFECVIPFKPFVALVMSFTLRNSSLMAILNSSFMLAGSVLKSVNETSFGNLLRNDGRKVHNMDSGTNIFATWLTKPNQISFLTKSVFLGNSDYIWLHLLCGAVTGSLIAFFFILF
jgi:hypothetical protein